MCEGGLCGHEGHLSSGPVSLQKHSMSLAFVQLSSNLIYMLLLYLKCPVVFASHVEVVMLIHGVTSQVNGCFDAYAYMHIRDHIHEWCICKQSEDEVAYNTARTIACSVWFLCLHLRVHSETLNFVCFKGLVDSGSCVNGCQNVRQRTWSGHDSKPVQVPSDLKWDSRQHLPRNSASCC